MPDIQIPSGLVAITTWGMVRGETLKTFSDMRSFTESAGLKNIQWEVVPGALVDKARNDVCRMALRNNHGWLLFCDADMVPPANALVNPDPNGVPGLLQVAYGMMPHADVLGALCPLRGEMALGTVDSGTGTWEGGWYPGSGIPQVMRTGGAFILIKRHVLEGLKDPWFRMQVPLRWIDAMASIDNFARIKFDGQNPFRNTAEQYWERLEKCAIDDPSIVLEHFTPVETGEDSNFCDRARNAGYKVFVDTDIPIGHVDSVVRTWLDHKKAMDESLKWQRLASGLLA